MLEMALAAFFVTVAVIAIGGRGFNTVGMSSLPHFAAIEDSSDLPCPWCQAQTREIDDHCASCGQRFG